MILNPAPAVPVELERIPASVGPWVRGIASKIVLRYRDRASRDRLRCDQRLSLSGLERDIQQALQTP